MFFFCDILLTDIYILLSSFKNLRNPVCLVINKTIWPLHWGFNMKKVSEPFLWLDDWVTHSQENLRWRTVTWVGKSDRTDSQIQTKKLWMYLVWSYIPLTWFECKPLDHLATSGWAACRSSFGVVDSWSALISSQTDIMPVCAEVSQGCMWLQNQRASGASGGEVIGQVEQQG